MATMKSVCIVVAVLLAHQQMISCYEVKNCASSGNADAELISLEVDSCPDKTADRCTFHKGTDATMQVEFKTAKPFTQANVGIWGKIGPIYIPFKLQGPTDACGNYGFDCPVPVGQTETFKISLPVLSQYPSISVSVRFEMNDEAKNPIVCFEFPVRLTNPPPRQLSEPAGYLVEEQQEEASS